MGKARFEAYRHVGHRLVGGWLAPEVLAITSALDSAQRSKKISGAIAEIGVHHGKFFLGLNLLLQDKEHSVAIDVFGDQDLMMSTTRNGRRSYMAPCGIWNKDDWFRSPSASIRSSFLPRSTQNFFETLYGPVLKTAC